MRQCACGVLCKSPHRGGLPFTHLSGRPTRRSTSKAPTALGAGRGLRGHVGCVAQVQRRCFWRHDTKLSLCAGNSPNRCWAMHEFRLTYQNQKAPAVFAPGFGTSASTLSLSGHLERFAPPDPQCLSHEVHNTAATGGPGLVRFNPGPRYGRGPLMRRSARSYGRA